MKTRFQTMRPVGELLKKAAQEKKLCPSAHWTVFDDIDCRCYAVIRPVPLVAPSPSLIAVTRSPVNCEESRFPIPFSPPRFQNGREVSRWIPCLKVSCGRKTFRIIKKSDGGKIVAIAHKLERVAKPEDVESFIATALKFIGDGDEKLPATARPTPDWSDPASGMFIRQRKGANISELGLPMFEYQNSDQAESAMSRTATFCEGLAGAKLMRKVFKPMK